MQGHAVAGKAEPKAAPKDETSPSDKEKEPNSENKVSKEHSNTGHSSQVGEGGKTDKEDDKKIIVEDSSGQHDLRPVLSYSYTHSSGSIAWKLIWELYRNGAGYS